MAQASLWGSVLKGDTQALQDALENGANVNFQGKLGGDTALHLVCSNISITNTAANAKLLDVAKLLILAEADINIKNNSGNTPLDIAKRKKDKSFAELLQTPESISPLEPVTPEPPPVEDLPPLEDLEGDQLLERAKQAEERAEAAERRAAQAGARVAELEEQNRSLMQKAGYSIPPDTIGKKQPLQPLDLPAGRGDVSYTYEQEQHYLGNGRQQLQPLSAAQHNGMAATVSMVPQQRQQQTLQTSYSTPALAAPGDVAKGPEFMLRELLQRGDITFKEYKEQQKKMAKNY